jgi:hypothetical protein
MTNHQNSNGAPKGTRQQGASSNPKQKPAADSSGGNQSVATHEDDKIGRSAANNSSATASKKMGNKNALSHGLYSKDVTLPWESQDDFEKLHKDFTEEWRPNGRSEKEAVLELTHYTWLKRRIIKSAQLQFVQSRGSEELKLGDVSWDEIIRHQAKLPEQALGAVCRVNSLIEDLNGVFETIRTRPYWTDDSEGKEVQSQLLLLRNDVATLIKNTEESVIAGVDNLVEIIRESKKRFEQAYQPEVNEKQLDLLAKVDVRIEKTLRRLTSLKVFKRVEAETAGTPKPLLDDSPALAPLETISTKPLSEESD